MEALPVEELLKEPLQVGVVGPVLESEGPAVLKVGAELGRVALAELLGAGGHFSVHDSFVFLFFGVGFKALPRQGTADEVHEHVAQGFEIVAARLFCGLGLGVRE